MPTTIAYSFGDRKLRVQFSCPDCGGRVVPHAEGGGQGAHFEHLPWTPNCKFTHDRSAIGYVKRKGKSG